jgi:hypothetical protein
MPIQISGLPLIKTLSDANVAFAVIIKKMARGEISLDDAERASAVIEKALNAIDLKDEVASAVREKKENEKLVLEVALHDTKNRGAILESFPW